MKYSKFYNKDQELLAFLLADTFGGILGVGLDTSVVDPLPANMHQPKSIKKLKRVVATICKNSGEVGIRDNYTSRKALIS